MLGPTAIIATKQSRSARQVSATGVFIGPGINLYLERWRYYAARPSRQAGVSLNHHQFYGICRKMAVPPKSCVRSCLGKLAQ